MQKIVYANQEHKSIIDIYISMCLEFTKEVSTASKYNNFQEVSNIIFEYHNNYGNGIRENNFYDWLMIIPINLSVACNGFFAGIETKSNRAIIRAYKLVLEEMLQQTVDAIDNIQPEND